MAEAKRRYLEQLNPKVRTLLAGVKRPDVESVNGLSPVVSLDQVYASHTIRSTVGTLSGIYDHFRLLFARFGVHPDKGSHFINKSHFSFNQPEGACQHCHGIGEDEYIDPSTFIIDKDPSRKKFDKTMHGSLTFLPKTAKFVQIFNAGIGGKLNAYPRINYNELFEVEF